MSSQALSQHKKDQPSQLRSFAFGVAFAGLIGQSVFLLSLPHASRTGSDLAGVLFLMLSLIYGGSLRLWWGMFAPLALILLFAPVARWEALEVVDLGRLLRASLVPGLGFVGGNLLVTLTSARRSSLVSSEDVRSLSERNMKSIQVVKSMESEMKDLVKALEASSHLKSPADALASLTWKMNDIKIEEGALLIQAPEADALSYLEFQNPATSAIEEMRAKTAGRRGLRIALASVIDAPVPMAVRGRTDTLAIIIKAILEQAIDSISGSEGLVRVALRPGLRSVSLVIEDNGRGLNEELISKLEAKGLMARPESKLAWAEIRTVVHASGWRMERQARLGVGARVTLELPRVDAFAYGARSIANREALQAEVSPQKDSGSRHA